MKTWMKKIIRIIIMFLVAGALIYVDILSKSHFEEIATSDMITFIPNVISFVYVKNSGAAFGIFQNNAYVLALFSIVFIVLFILLDFIYGKKNWWYKIGFCFVLGGAIGNLFDRIKLGFVRDFIYLDFMDWFPVFNLADVFLTIGVICFAVYIIFFMQKDKKTV